MAIADGPCERQNGRTARADSPRRGLRPMAPAVNHDAPDVSQSDRAGEGAGFRNRLPKPHRAEPGTPPWAGPGARPQAEPETRRGVSFRPMRFTSQRPQWFILAVCRNATGQRFSATASCGARREARHGPHTRPPTRWSASWQEGQPYATAPPPGDTAREHPQGISRIATRHAAGCLREEVTEGLFSSRANPIHEAMREAWRRPLEDFLSNQGAGARPVKACGQFCGKDVTRLWTARILCTGFSAAARHFSCPCAAARAP